MRHCNVALVVLGFIYENHAAPAYKFNDSPRDMSIIGKHLSVFSAIFVLCMRGN